MKGELERPEPQAAAGTALPGRQGVTRAGEDVLG